MFMSVVNRDFRQAVEPVATARWTKNVDTGCDAPLGHGDLGNGEADLCFLVTRNALSGTGVLGCDPVVLPLDGWALRLDEVAFTVGAVAHRHTHSGSGWRHLVAGTLRIEAEHDTTVMSTGDSWFEPAQSPVRAVALQERGDTRFVRCMVIPLADVGQSTFKLQSPKDADLPRLQITHRHFDHVVQVDAL
ncbi:Cupin domain protein [Octadecabacter temperatus]|uniref:Cupin domain protein n=1 Tax=Octadecabacter temperatus TaxID=1458307 RepID=A0A0K0Y399_9RHOB|nr:Cupin domain protein [Octadecabacter temperatus]SIN90906.1 Cupin domain protein [Octadecabacter temperatus]